MIDDGFSKWIQNIYKCISIESSIAWSYYGYDKQNT